MSLLTMKIVPQFYSVKMQVFIFLLAFGSNGISQEFGDDNAGGDWLPIPDGYVWPKAAKEAPTFETETHLLTELSEDKRDAVRKFWPLEEMPERVELAEIDLNCDGRNELLVVIPALGGTGGRFYAIITPVNEKTYRFVGDIQGWGFQFLETKSGWFQIEGMSRGGGGHYTRYLLTYSDKHKEYRTSRNEGHDFNFGKVEVRKVDE